MSGHIKRFVFLLFLPFVHSAVDFMDCGSERLFIDKIDIPGCGFAPCPLSRGFKYHMYVIPDHLDPRVDSIELNAFVRLRGALFSISATCINPCITKCPLQRYLERPRLDFVIEVPKTLLRHPAVLYLMAIHKNRGEKKNAICVSININLI